MILGAVLAGGKATRFGSDKALAELNGQTLLARAVDALSGWCEHVIVVGRERAPAPTLPDWPRPDMGPLAGIAAALRHARDEGYDAVLTCGVDSAGLPDNLLRLLSPAPAYIESQPVIGFWPADACAELERILQSAERHSMRHFASQIGARAVNSGAKPANINTPDDLKAAEIRDGL